MIKMCPFIQCNTSSGHKILVHTVINPDDDDFEMNLYDACEVGWG